MRRALTFFWFVLVPVLILVALAAATSAQARVSPGSASSGAGGSQPNVICPASPVTLNLVGTGTPGEFRHFFTTAGETYLDIPDPDTQPITATGSSSGYLFVNHSF